MKKAMLLLGVFVLCASLSFGALTWNTTSSLPVGTSGAAVIQYNGYVYLVGGRTATEPYAVDDVYFAKINTDGTIGAWAATTALPGNRALLGAYAYDGRLYVWGGWKEDYTTMPTCFYAPINPTDGTVGAWITSAVAIPPDGTTAQMDSFGRGVLGFGKYIYILGGEKNDSVLSSKVFYSEIQSSGDFGAWTETTALPTPTNGGAAGYWFMGVMTVAGTSANYIYVLGGNHSGTSETHILINTINSNGTLGAAWTESATPLNNGVYEVGCAYAGDSIFVTGGLNGSTPQAFVQQVKINPADGSVVSVTDETVLPVARARGQAVGYSIGGKDFVSIVGGGGYLQSEDHPLECLVAEYAVPTPTPTPIPPTPTPPATNAKNWENYK